MNLFRIHVRPDGGTASAAQTFDYCVAQGIIGVGWGVDGLPDNPSWQEYREKADLVHLDGYKGCRYLWENVERGDLLWTRSAAGEYYLARAKTEWKYWQTQQAIDEGIDIANVVDCEFQKVRIDDVPGKVIACFRPRRTLQRIDDAQVLEYSKFLWNDLTGNTVYEVTKPANGDLFTMLDAEETEDLVCLYLQTQRWLLVPNSRKGDTMSYEYYLVRPDSGEVAFAQIKTGHSAINLDLYREYTDIIFFFQPNNAYGGVLRPNMEIVEREKLLAFFRQSKSWLPHKYRRKADLIGFV